ncbi:MAG: hypothetical protein ACI4EF_08630, partial [Coprococcus sp.]
IPECLYSPQDSVNGQKKMMEYSKGSYYFISLGFMSFRGMYKNVHIDDALTKSLSNTGADMGEIYYESLLFECIISPDSPMYSQGKVSIKRTGRMQSVMNKVISASERKILNITGVSDMCEQRYFTIEGTDIDVTIPADANQDLWFDFLNHGLADRIKDIFQMYDDVEKTQMCYENDKLYICISNKIKRNRFNETNDFVINNIDRICSTISKMPYLCGKDLI